MIDQLDFLPSFPNAVVVRDTRPCRLPAITAWVEQKVEAYRKSAHAASQAQSEATKLEREADTLQAEAFSDTERAPDVGQLRDEASEARRRASTHRATADGVVQELAAAILRGAV